MNSGEQTPNPTDPTPNVPATNPSQEVNSVVANSSVKALSPAEIVAAANAAKPALPAQPLKGKTTTVGALTENNDLPPIPHGFVMNPNAHSARFERKKVAFLENLYDALTPEHTCQAIGVSLRTFYDWLKNDKNFNDAYVRVDRHLTARLARQALSRGIRGSDNLLMFMLKSRDARYRDKVQAEVDPKQLEQIVSTFVNALRKNVPNTCPHCKSDLKLDGKVREMLVGLSKGLRP